MQVPKASQRQDSSIKVGNWDLSKKLGKHNDASARDRGRVHTSPLLPFLRERQRAVEPAEVPE